MCAYIPSGPAILTGVNGLKFLLKKDAARRDKDVLLSPPVLLSSLSSSSSSLGAKPHGSSRIRCLTRLGCLIVYQQDK